MPSYFSNEFKTAVRDAMDNVHTSFGRNITLYHETMQSIDPLDILNNPLFGRPSTSTTSSIPVKTATEILARIRYLGKQDEDIATFGGKMELMKSQGLVRVKVEEQYVNEMKTATDIEVDNVIFHLTSDAYKIGPWPTDSYTGNFCAFILQRSD